MHPQVCINCILILIIDIKSLATWKWLVTAVCWLKPKLLGLTMRTSSGDWAADMAELLLLTATWRAEIPSHN